MTSGRGTQADAGTSDTNYFFDPLVAGRQVQADGGNAEIGSRLGSREMFEGTLSGRRMDQGDPPWRWLEIGDLTVKPAEFTGGSVWCEESYVYFIEHRAERGAEAADGPGEGR